MFRSAWLDQRVKEGELDVSYVPESQTFAYIQPDRDASPSSSPRAELGPRRVLPR